MSTEKKIQEPVLAKPGPYGIDLEAGKDYYWCKCGLSKTQPFCDGSHKGTGITPLKFTPDETKKYWLCGCKVTANAPFCDGTHRKEKGIAKYNEFLLKQNTELKAKVEKAEKQTKLVTTIATGSAVAAILGFIFIKLRN